MNKTIKPTAAHRALGVLAGNWITYGTIHAVGDAAATEMHAIDQYEWLPGEFFMLHKVEALIGGTASRSIEIIGFDAAQGCYVSRSYDDQGSSEQFTAHLKNRAWVIDGLNTRFRGAFNASRTVLAGTWEKLADGKQWTPWMDIELGKVT